jgi:Protein of unknown function (DUF2726)
VPTFGSPIELKIDTDDPLERQVCEAYWTCTPDGVFLEPIARIAKRFETTSQRVNAIVERSCVAMRIDCQCQRCGKPTALFKRRYQFESAQFDIYSEPGKFDYCAECREQVRKEEQAGRAQAKLDMMRWALEGTVYQSLEPLEFDFLVQIAFSFSAFDAQKRIGISRKDGMKLLAKLDSLHLINWSENSCEGTWEPVKMLDELKNVLRGQTLRRRVKSIFGSPKAVEVFRKLKSQHPFVYPEIPLCAFVEKSDVEHLFEQGDLNYFLTCRVDFLICERDGTPICALEYQGGYHGDAQQAKRDEFKRRVLSAVGLPLTTVTSADLKNAESLP